MLTALQNLIEVVAQLRSPDGGCPWDLAQTPETLIPYVLEEAYEVVDAIRQGNPAEIADELGDLLLQVILQAQIASEAKQFGLTTVAETITAKLIRRHPHVFGGIEVANVEEVRQNWEAIKATEPLSQTETNQARANQFGANQANTPQTSTELVPRLRRYARSLPPLTAAMKISRKAAATGFEWENVAGVWAKFHEELAEFEQALQSETKAAQQAELGDLLFTLVNLARWYDLDPEEALNSTNQRFIDRLSWVEHMADRPLTNCTIDELEQLWQQAKARLEK
jgi:XTP/dITP diphosphohydrolase